MRYMILFLFLGIALQAMEKQSEGWDRNEAIAFFNSFFQLPYELQEKIWCRITPSYRSTNTLCFAKYESQCPHDCPWLPRTENVIVGPNNNELIVASGTLYQKKHQDWIITELPCKDIVYGIDHVENRWIQARDNQLKIFDYEEPNIIEHSGTITLKNPIAMALFKAKNTILSFSESGLEEHKLLHDKLVSSNQLVARDLFDAFINQKKGSAKVHLVKDMGYCAHHNLARLSCYSSHGFKTFFIDLKTNRIFLTCKGWVTFLNEQYTTAYNPSSLEKPVFSISFRTVEESLQHAKKAFDDYQNQ